MCQKVAREHARTLIRINRREPDVPPGHISLPLCALAALTERDARRSSHESPALHWPEP
jgi:hypothetical protein